MTAHAPPAPVRLPPGPSFPRWLQTLGFMVGGVRYLEWCRRRYGDIITMGTLFDRRFVMLFEPATVKELFQGSTDGLHAGRGQRAAGPDRRPALGAAARRRRAPAPPPAVAAPVPRPADARPRETMRECADAEIDRWPVGEPFTLLESMQSLTLRVILRAVFGYAPGAEEDELARRLRDMVEPLSPPRGVLVLNAVMRGRRDAGRRPAVRGAQARRGRDHLRRDRPPPGRRRPRRARRRLLRAAAGPRRGRRGPRRPRGPRRAADAAARRPRDDGHRAGLDVRPGAA